MAGVEPDQASADALRPQEIFISYRRNSDLVVEQLHEKLSTLFGPHRIFLDRVDIEPGAHLPDTIRAAAEHALVVLVVIGHNWISIQDERTYRRCLDMPGDWVRKEIELALAGSGTLIPVLVEDAAMPTREQLPASLVPLATREPMMLSRANLNADFDRLAKVIHDRLGRERAERLGRQTTVSPVLSASANDYRPSPLSEKQIADMLKWLPQWRVVESALDDDPRGGSGYKRIEIRRDFRFESFMAAMDFMREAADAIQAINHHPRWENLFRTVTVSYSTWQVGHRLSDRDLKSAEMVEGLYQRYAGK